MNKISKIAKSKAYSWRPSADLKTALEAAAKDEEASIDTILERLVREWLANRAQSDERALSDEEDAEQQRQMREAALKAAGTVSIGLGPYTNRRVREVMGEILEKKYRGSQRRAPRRSR
jgi:ATP-dependent helicase YprA (DUF1998 family)